jgi:dTMP kinase
VRGRFITLEGGEGAGKSTQLKRLASELRERGHDVIETREPGGSPGAEAIRELLLNGPEDRWTAETEALLFAAARADHVARTIRPALERGAWVLCDRFLDSSLAYQGGAGGVGGEAVRALHAVGSAGLLPDRTLLLQIDPSLPPSARTGATATAPTASAPAILPIMRKWPLPSLRLPRRSRSASAPPTPTARRRSDVKAARGAGGPAVSPLFGHEEAVAAFRDGLGSGRLHHAWLISGPRGSARRCLQARPL